MRFSYGYFSCLWLLIVVTACAPKKHLTSSLNEDEWTVGTAKEKAAYVDSLMRDVWDFNRVKARAKGFLTINDQDNHEVNVHIRMVQDESIWISATALLGLEVGRVLITPDSIWLVNRMESVYYKDSYEAGNHWLGADLSFWDLQQILVGNSPDHTQLEGLTFTRNEQGEAYFSNVISSSRAVDSFGSRQGIAQEIIFDTNRRLQWWRGQLLDLRHAYSPSTATPSFPSKTTVLLQAGLLKLVGTLTYNRLELDEDFSLPFTIPNGYKQIH